MENIPEQEFFELNSGVLEEIRTKYGLNGPGRMKEAIQILEEWIQKQPHFKKKNFSPVFLETCLIARKGSIERTKLAIDKLCTMRTLMPQYFVPVNIARDFDYFRNFMLQCVIPKHTKENYRVCALKLLRSNFSRKDYINFAVYCIMSVEYMKIYDYADGILLLFDLSGINILELTLNMDLVVTKEVVTVLLDGYGFRLKGIHIICESSLVNTFVDILKVLLSSKLAKRIFVHKKVSEVHNYVDRKILPKEFGGEEQRSMQEIADLWMKVLSTEKNMKFMAEASDFCTDETCRREDSFIEQYAGMAGTFRALQMD